MCLHGLVPIIKYKDVTYTSALVQPYLCDKLDHRQYYGQLCCVILQLHVESHISIEVISIVQLTDVGSGRIYLNRP